jgi:hypothetical protein
MSSQRSVFPINRIGCKCLGLDWEIGLPETLEKVPIDPHGPKVPEEMIERIIAALNMRELQRLEKRKQKR